MENNDFAGKVCPYCNKGFDNSDDVTFCRFCGAPHHKSCEIKSSENNAENERNTDPLYCPYCEYTYHTAARRSASAQEHQEEDKYIVRNLQYYKTKFLDIRIEEKNVNWNWAAFFFGPSWFLYRKMYAITALYIVIIVAFNFLEPLDTLLRLVTYVIFAMISNTLYMRHIEKLLIKEKTIEEAKRDKFIRRHAGVTVRGVVIYILCILFLYIMTYELLLHFINQRA